ncbi:MAG: M48 family metalloprotease [Terriglobales bacterium]
MKTRLARRAPICCLAVLCAAGIAVGQCPALPSLQALPAGDFFTPAQEAEIGALMRRQQGGSPEEFQDPRLMAHAQAVLKRLEAALPASGYQFRLHLLDVPYSDAFVIPGGDIYFTRPMVNLLANDDGLAGVFAHEMGHVATHQLGLILSREFEAAGMRAPGGGAELGRQFNRMLTWQERMQTEGEHHEERSAEDNQVAADHVGMLLLVHAGFPPSAYVRAFDRIADLQGRTGGWLQTLLGTVSPDQNRLRASEAEAKQLAALCPPAPAAAGEAQGFTAWKAAVVAATNTWTAKLPGLLTRQTLEPPLDEYIQLLRFSPDGRHLLAQEGDDVWVLGRDPLRVELRITMPKALDPTFTPDSRSVVLHTPGLRIERWDIASRSRAWLVQLPEPAAFCVSTYLNPAGDRLACLRTNGSLILYNTLTGAIVTRRDQVLKPVLLQLGGILMAMGASHPFFTASPSGRSLLVMTDPHDAIALDMETGAPIDVGGKPRWRVAPGLAFLSETEVAVQRAKKRRWDIVEFPSGRVLRTVKLPASWVRPVTAGKEWIVGRVSGHAAAVFDPSERARMTLGASTPGLDGYDGVFAAQVGSGVALVKPGAPAPQILARLPLPSATLAALNAAAVSPDLTRLAISAGDRGGIWNLAAGRKEMTLRRFDGAWLNQGHAWMEFPAYLRTPPMLVTIDLSARRATGGPPQDKIGQIVQAGPYLAVEAPYFAPRKDARRSSAPWTRRTYTVDNSVVPSADDVASWSWTLGRVETVSDVRTGRAIWHETFDDDAPTVGVDLSLSALLLGWNASHASLDRALGKEFDLTSRHVADRKDAVWIVALDPGSGKKIAALLLDPAPVVNVYDSAVIGQRLFIEDDIGRLLVYDLPSGKLAGVLDGVLAAASAIGREVALLTGKHRALLVNADTLATTLELTFPAEAGFLRFSRDGSKLLAMTRDQTVYTFAVAALRQAVRADAAH